jgi:hypothetical protein
LVSLRPNFTPETSPEPVDLESDALQVLITGTALGRRPLLPMSRTRLPS